MGSRPIPCFSSSEREAQLTGRPLIKLQRRKKHSVTHFKKDWRPIHLNKLKYKSTICSKTLFRCNIKSSVEVHLAAFAGSDLHRHFSRLILLARFSSSSYFCVFRLCAIWSRLSSWPLSEIFTSLRLHVPSVEKDPNSMQASWFTCLQQDNKQCLVLVRNSGLLRELSVWIIWPVSWLSFQKVFTTTWGPLRFSQSRPFLLDHLFWLDGKVTSGKYLLEMLIYWVQCTFGNTQNLRNGVLDHSFMVSFYRVSWTLGFNTIWFVRLSLQAHALVSCAQII